MKKRKIESMNNGRSALSFRREQGIDNVMIIRQKRREVEASKITEQIEKKISRYEGYIDRLERKAGSQFQPGDEGIPLIFLFLLFFCFDVFD